MSLGRDRVHKSHIFHETRNVLGASWGERILVALKTYPAAILLLVSVSTDNARYDVTVP